MYKNKIKHIIGRFPVLFRYVYLIIGGANNRNECLFRSNDELVIEGFPRSANTFAVVAFRFAQREKVLMGHHLHAEAQVINGVNHKKPVMVLLRNPKDAIASLLIREPTTELQWVISRYIQFYRAVDSVSENVLVADFNEVTNDYGKVIAKFNLKFGTEYKLFLHNKLNVDAVFQKIDLINSMFDDGAETHVSRPSLNNTRKKSDQLMEDIINHPHYGDASRLYEKLKSLN